MKCIDFDKQFERYTRDWMEKNAEKYNNNMDVIEAMMPDIYMAFMSQPAAWLDGQSPEAYFEQFDDAAMLTRWMCDYYEQGVPVPDLLLERITALGEDAEAQLLALPFGKGVAHEAALTAISLLQELESIAPMQAYVEFIASLDTPDEKGDMCAEALLSMGEMVVQPILDCLDDAKETGRDIFADILSNFPGEEKTFTLLMERFERCEDRKALFASYLAKYGDDRALPVLLAAALNDNTNYLDYVEIVSAIDELGGERPPERDFDGDPYYESLKRI